jgi:hypothetical protein
MGHLVGNAADEQSLQVAQTARSHDDEIGVTVFGGVEDNVRWIAVGYDTIDLDRAVLPGNALGFVNNGITDTYHDIFRKRY